MVERNAPRPTAEPESRERSLAQFLLDAKQTALWTFLDQREQSVLENHWLKGSTLAEIAPTIGVTTRERVRQIEARAWATILNCLPDQEKAQISDLLSNKRQDPEYRQRMSQVRQSPEYRQRMSQVRQEQWQDPEHRQRMSQVMQEQWQDPEYRQRMSQVMQSPEYRQRMSQVRQEQWQDPEYRQRMSQVRQDPEYRQRMTEAQRKRRAREKAGKTSQ